VSGEWLFKYQVNTVYGEWPFNSGEWPFNSGEWPFNSGEWPFNSGEWLFNYQPHTGLWRVAIFREHLVGPVREITTNNKQRIMTYDALFSLSPFTFEFKHSHY